MTNRVPITMGLAAALMLLLSGCLSFATITSVSAAGTFTGTMSLSYSREMAGEFGVTDLAQAKAELGGADVAGEQVSVAWSETETDYVQTFTFTDATADQIDQAATTTSSSEGPDGQSTTTSRLSFPLVAEVSDGDPTKVTVSLRDEIAESGEQVTGDGSADGGKESRRATRKMADLLFGDGTAAMTITMPGPIDTVTGAIPEAAADSKVIKVSQPDPATFEFSAPFIEMVLLAEESGTQPGLVITATADPTMAPTAAAVPASGAPDPTTTGAGDTASGPQPMAIAGAAGALAALIVLVALLVRARRRGSEGGIPGGIPGGPPSQGE